MKAKLCKYIFNSFLLSELLLNKNLLNMYSIIVDERDIYLSVLRTSLELTVINYLFKLHTQLQNVTCFLMSWYKENVCGHFHHSVSYPSTIRKDMRKETHLHHLALHPILMLKHQLSSLILSFGEPK